jgi:hypothetical protein
MVVLLAVNVVLMSVLMYAALSRYPVESATAALQWFSLYLFAVVYPAGWVFLHFRVLRRLGLEDRKELRQHAWAPIVVGTTSFAIAISLLMRLAR